MSISAKWLNKVKWNEIGLVPVIAQELGSNDVLMFAWMNRDALSRTLELGEAVYWSRSRKKLWHKGEESGHYQKVHEIRLDCDEDVVLLKVEQVGGIACHTGRHSCFFQKLEGNADSAEWNIVEIATAAEQLPADGAVAAENSAAAAAAAAPAAVVPAAAATSATTTPAETTEARPAAKRVRKTPTKTPT